MILLFPALARIAIVTSAMCLMILWWFADVRFRAMAVFLGWLLVAAYLQFFTLAPVVNAVGLLLRTILAITLILRWRLARF